MDIQRGLAGIGLGLQSLQWDLHEKRHVGARGLGLQLNGRGAEFDILGVGCVRQGLQERYFEGLQACGPNVGSKGEIPVAGMYNHILAIDFDLELAETAVVVRNAGVVGDLIEAADLFVDVPQRDGQVVAVADEDPPVASARSRNGN